MQTEIDDTHTHSTSPFLHPCLCCPLSLICSFPLKTPWTYGPLKTAVSNCKHINTHVRTHSFQSIGVGQQVYWI